MINVKYLSKEELEKRISRLEQDVWFYKDSPNDTFFDVAHAALMEAREELKRRENEELLDNEWYD